jgi:TetR/AcrR family transcriptional regulator, regulator of cefoperazone and chloramphenicol sensitivity
MAFAVDDQTAERLIEAAGEVFGEQGFQLATIRDICARAGANVAAVNYHYRDKMGLYLAVLRKSLSRESPDAVRQLVEKNENPEEALGLIIRHILRMMYGTGERNAWHVRIMVHELAHPSAALDLVVEEVIGPIYLTMRQVLSRLLGTPPDHDTTRLCAHSVIGQVVHYAHAREVIARLWPDLKMTKDRLDQIGKHITEFSIYSLRALASRKGASQ